MADPEKQPEDPKVAKEKKIIAQKVTGTVKWFNVKAGYGFINRKDTEEDVFVHQSAILKNNPRKFLRSVGDGEEVEFDVVVGEKGNEAANVTGPNGAPVRGSVYAPEKRWGGFRRGNYAPRGYPRRPRFSSHPRSGQYGEGTDDSGDGMDEEGEYSDAPVRGRGRGRGRGLGRGRGGRFRGYGSRYVRRRRTEDDSDGRVEGGEEEQVEERRGYGGPPRQDTRGRGRGRGYFRGGNYGGYYRDRERGRGAGRGRGRGRGGRPRRESQEGRDTEDHGSTDEGEKEIDEAGSGGENAQRGNNRRYRRRGGPNRRGGSRSRGTTLSDSERKETDGEQDVKENGVDDGEHDDAHAQEGKETKKAASQSNKASDGEAPMNEAKKSEGKAEPAPVSVVKHEAKEAGAPDAGDHVGDETDGEQDVKENGVDDGEHDDAHAQEGKETKKAASQSNKASDGEAPMNEAKKGEGKAEPAPVSVVKHEAKEAGAPDAGDHVGDGDAPQAVNNTTGESTA
ncbi:unnamed protein product [Darwinula stevensoni]|uniref:CSD domain-containing protein n=1 Tax=Darwinula stevensoni TaxID=69355 RepID=A0A7R9FRW1_9CRUS|nr:unnamed protein product [Darwinula stevensoni]CAG0902519.1 unnamed protein product [Darwinula stevensoni]